MACAGGGAVRAQRMSTRRGVQQAVVSVAGLVSAPVSNQAGQLLGRVVDLIAHMQPEEHYPPVTGLLVRVARGAAFCPRTPSARSPPPSCAIANRANGSA